MRTLIIFFAFSLSSCSVIQTREPASIEFNCRKEIGEFYSTHSSIKQATSLMNELQNYPEDKNEVLEAFKLIKKKYPDFNDEQIIAHYNLLSSTCHKF